VTDAATADVEQALARRREAAAHYRPNEIDLLLVAEAPPAALDRYFYFDDVPDQDSLFRYVCRVLLGQEPTREGKPQMLQELCELGAFLIDVRETPVDGTPLRNFVPSLVQRCRVLEPRHIILIKATVFDASHQSLRAAGLPVSEVRVPFPGSGRQHEFVAAFTRALRECR
jgi:hypothetical protein